MKTCWLGAAATSCALGVFFFPLNVTLAQDASSSLGLSGYGCEATGDPGPKRTLHVGQIINGVYNEWFETYLIDESDTSAAPELSCIEKIEPKKVILSVEDAATFLQQSSAIGAPTNTKPPASERQQDWRSIEPPDVKPQPLMRAIPDSETQPSSLTSNEPLRPATYRRPDPPPPSPLPELLNPPYGPEEQHSDLKDSAAIRIGDDIVGHPSHNLAGFLSVTYPNNESYRCSGYIVSPWVVLTAGHCVHNRFRGGYVKEVRFYPAQYEDDNGVVQTPYGVNTDFAFINTTEQWTEISGPESRPVSEYQYDLAAIQFNTPFIFTKTFTPLIFNYAGSLVTNIGYPSTDPNTNEQTQDAYWDLIWETDRSETTLRDIGIREFDAKARSGSSGSAFLGSGLLLRGGVVGLLAYGDETIAGGPWMNSGAALLLQHWATWQPETTAGLRIANVGSSANTNYQSFFRFYNSSSTIARSITVSLHEGNSGAYQSTWTSPEIAPGAQIQVDIGTIEETASFTLPQIYTAYITPGYMSGYVQHVLFNPNAGALTNVSICSDRVMADPTTLIGVHSGLLADDFPSTVVVNNVGLPETSTTLGIYDAADGTKLGSYTTNPIPNRAQVAVPVTEMETQANISPSTYHYVIKAEFPFSGFLQHFVETKSAGVTTDLTTVCALR